MTVDMGTFVKFKPSEEKFEATYGDRTRNLLTTGNTF